MVLLNRSSLLGRWPVLLCVALLAGGILFYALCELMPKTLFRLYPNRLCMMMAIPFRLVHLALKPDGGELMVSNFDSDNISIIETTTNEVGGSYLIGTHPARGLVTADNSRLYVSNFGSNTVAVYDIDVGKMIATLPVGSHSLCTRPWPKARSSREP